MSSFFDPSRPTVTADSDHYIRTSVPSFQNLAIQNNFQAKTMFITGETMGLA